MTKLWCLSVLVCMIICRSIASEDACAPPAVKQQMFDDFQTKFNKTYANTGEAEMRFGIFLSNLAEIDQRNALEASNNGTAIHGITIFSDMSQEEFVQQFLGTQSNVAAFAQGAEVVKPTFTLDPAGTLVDWTAAYTTPVKDQACSHYLPLYIHSVVIMLHAQ
jgi:hypothetical protein